ncbi:glycosyl transferase family 2 [Chryseobacterium soli]|uniref:Glycosyl transferase family 2 n=1 Tax=Chryseobacterium soli TaxID=445961 RepID=A0A086A9M5_9FLAO|nr:glycosyltransferase [Chryseobacterium soli]KFF13389.1 glycosyl transferase family 2 [Chryseobacterium soli]
MINISIVLYNTSSEDINNFLSSFSQLKLEFNLILVDNSETNSLEKYFKEFNFIQYIHNPSNPGFGASHNIALKKSLEDSRVKYHFVVNPDAYFKGDVISDMISYMNTDSEIGMLMPQILNEDGTVQFLPKLLPSPMSILLRKIKSPFFIYNDFINKYELRFVDQSEIYNAPILSGCFTLFRCTALKEIGLYDDRFFMYFEDWDISRRMHKKYKTIYYPKVSIYHKYESGANKNKKLFKIFLASAYRYFSKWGWFFDFERTNVNKETISQFK